MADHIEEELRQKLESIGFRCAREPVPHEFNECKWYAYRRSELPARTCECNSDQPGAQIVVKPFVALIHGEKRCSVTIELVGEAGGEWWNLSAYNVAAAELLDRLPAIELSLVAAWNALSVPAKSEVKNNG